MIEHGYRERTREMYVEGILTGAIDDQSSRVQENEAKVVGLTTNEMTQCAEDME